MNFNDFGGVVFDLDGTLLDTLADIGNAANSVLRHHHFPEHPIRAYAEFVGDGVRMLLTRSLPPAHRDVVTLEACLKTMAIEYPRHLNQTTRPYPGIMELLLALRKRGLRLAVLSNKPHEFTGTCIHQFFGSDVFDPIFGLQPQVPKKPHPAGALRIAADWRLLPGQILYLGDSGTDMQTAVAAGMHPIGVLWGFRGAEELLAHGAKRLIKNPLDLLTEGNAPS